MIECSIRLYIQRSIHNKENLKKNKKMKNIYSVITLLCLAFFMLSCQNNNNKKVDSDITQKPMQTQSESPMARFEKEIVAFEATDKKNGFTKNGILFTGSSSIRMWSTMKEDLKDFPTLNRGFGGSTIPEVLHFMGRYVFQHTPQVIVFYCGENDISEGATPQTVFSSFKAFVKIVEVKSPTTKIVFISMKPSLARWNLWDKYKEGNELIKNYIDTNPNLEYMDCGISMLQNDGKVKDDIFIEDGLHMNAKGYKGWTNQLKPILEGIYKTN